MYACCMYDVHVCVVVCVCVLCMHVVGVCICVYTCYMVIRWMYVCACCVVYLCMNVLHDVGCTCVCAGGYMHTHICVVSVRACVCIMHFVCDMRYLLWLLCALYVLRMLCVMRVCVYVCRVCICDGCMHVVCVRVCVCSYIYMLCLCVCCV